VTQVPRNLISLTSLESCLCGKFKMSSTKKVGERAWILFLNGKPTVGAEPLGERAELCMQNMEGPHPRSRPKLAAANNNTLGPSAQGL
jgi:hypothetical protein